MKIRIFALAKELGIDSKELIEYAARAGVIVKNSALASISEAERDTIVNFMSEASAEKSASFEQLVPARPSAAESTGKVRQIKSAGRSRSTTQEDAGTATATLEPPATVEFEEAESAEIVEPADVAAETTAAPSDEAAPPADAETDVDAATEEAAETDEKVAPIRRDDYVPAAGTTGSSIREMKPRGTVPESENQQSRQGKARGKQMLPNVAAPPTYKQPKAKAAGKDEGPVQKPDMKLTPDILKQANSPLAGHLRKHHEKKGKKRPGEEEDRETPRGGKRGSLLEQRREQRRQLQVEKEERAVRRRAAVRTRRNRATTPAALKTSAEIQLPITLRGLSEALGRPLNLLQKSLFNQGKIITVNDNIDEESALELALEMGVDLEVKREWSIEDTLAELLDTPDAEEACVSRPPIITILGHVDHGKTTLLDKIRSADVAGGEAGGITQHIAAYQVEHNGQKIAFVDTPGHAAFGEMRARGADVTDIVVLVVAADDGVMPQTMECISHAKAAKVPIIVAMNKIDLPDVNEQKVLQELAAQDVLPSEWGGDTEVVRTSATTGQGIDDLLENILLTAELHEYKADPGRQALGVCLEAFRDEGRGVVAWLIVQRGTLRIGDVVLCGEAYGRIRAMYNDRDEELTEAGPSTPVRVTGLDVVPGAGDHFFVRNDVEEARRVAADRHHLGRTQHLAGRGRPRTLEDILNAARGGTVQDLPLIIKADTPGSLEALHSEIVKYEHPEVRVDIVHEAVGGVNESDVALASASGAIVIAFHVIPEDRAQIMAESEGVDIRRYNIIYEVTDEIKRQLEGLLEPERVEVATGRALVLQTFHISRYGTIAGCRVLSGNIDRANRMHVIRDQTVLNDYNIASLRREKDDVKEVREGMECGIRLDGFNDVKDGDLLEAYRIDRVKRTLDAT